MRCATREGTRLRVGPRKRTVWYVEEAGGTRLRVGGAARRMISSLRSDEGGVATVENLCIIRANDVGNRHRQV